MSTVRVDEEALRASRPAIVKVADQVADAVRAARAAIEAEGECWGADEIGREFADKYSPAATEGLTGLDLLQQAVNGVSEGVGAIATDFGVQDENNATGVQQAAQ
ncbi:hypothetical protein [Nocardia sp. NBC_01329]|uniref:hypothetical protein n=1 Tax=Nocardia sp. NBC_01329 TaxID=2903594 RepID=UPI002E15909D|nr:hypothetical protein OG405_17510 [Nocardia sp. NBC_01329]